MRAIGHTAARRLLTVLETVEGYAATLAYAGVAALLIGDVIAREVFASPILGSQSLAVLAAIVAGFLGLSLATSSGSHLRPEFLDRALPPRFDPFVSRASDLIAAVFYVAIAVFALRFVDQSRVAGDRAAVLYFQLWPIQLVIPYAFISSALRHMTYALYPDLKHARKGDI
ncbi:MAG: TRAP transporter small permease subunit [Rhodobacteraceae bacterium]|jgi:TRAP-type C4-dicarboxylate transport system permease small subunit|nr:TRAP transporter small permease subunit [Paracoccaceae bacterium]